jgi:hypothetical protein
LEDYAASYDAGYDNTQQSAMISVCSGAMTGAFAVWLGSEK